MSEPHATVAIYHEQTRWALSEGYVELIRASLDGRMPLKQVRTRRELLDVLPTTEVLIGYPLTDNVLPSEASLLQWVQLTQSTGGAVASLADAVRAGLRVSTASSIRAPQVSEHAMALLLALTRRIHEMQSHQNEHVWASDVLAHHMGTLDRATVGIVAPGAIGDALAQRLRAFGATPIATRRNPDRNYTFIEDVYPQSELNKLLSRCDAVVVAAPRLPDTIGLLGARSIGHLRTGAMLVDVSSSGVVDHKALLDAVRKERLSGVALDVFDSEPLPSSHPFWTMPSVIVSPRVAAASPRYWQHATEVICANIRRYLRDEALIDEVPASWLGTP